MRKLTGKESTDIARMLEYNGNIICSKVKVGAIEIAAAIGKLIDFAKHLGIQKEKKITVMYIKTATRISKMIARHNDKFVGTSVIPLKAALDITIVNVKKDLSK